MLLTITVETNSPDARVSTDAISEALEEIGMVMVAWAEGEQ